MDTPTSPGPAPGGPPRARAFTQDTAQVLALDKTTGTLRYLPAGEGNGETEAGVTWRSLIARGMLLCPMPGCGAPFGRVVAGGARRHHFAHRPGTADHDHGTGPETLWHLNAKDVLHRWAATCPQLAGWTLHLDDTRVLCQDDWRRPDVLAVSPDGARVAFEAQYSELTGTAWKARHDFYARAKVADIWLLAHHGPQWRPATPRQLRREELALHESAWVAAIQLSGLHQTMLRHGVTPLWLDPSTQMIGTATTRIRSRHTRARLEEDAAYTLPPGRAFPACHLAADPLEQCVVDLAAGQLLTPAGRVHHRDRERFEAGEKAALERAALLQARRDAEHKARTLRRRAAEQDKRRASAARAAEEQQAQQRREQEQRQRREQEEAQERAAAEARQKLPLVRQFPPVFEHETPAPARRPWWKPWRRRA
ncbi:hypothetical protein ABT160_29915 [Streptomyces sp. NPDC001941]|uniref:DUF6035 family protein n=1 Tax=Streptomyces sp. NPDC001941 TaxID=3154659 RepID=UPI003326CFFC